VQVLSAGPWSMGPMRCAGGTPRTSPFSSAGSSPDSPVHSMCRSNGTDFHTCTDGALRSRSRRKILNMIEVTRKLRYDKSSSSDIGYLQVAG
jgi:hypothetical protein